MLTNELTDHLRSLDVVPSGYALRTGRVEASVVRAVMLKLPLSGFNETLDQSGGFFKGSQQIVVRSPDPEEAYNVAVAIQSALRLEGGELVLQNWKVTLFRPEGMPLVFPINEADHYEASMYFRTTAFRLP